MIENLCWHLLVGKKHLFIGKMVYLPFGCILFTEFF